MVEIVWSYIKFCLIHSYLILLFAGVLGYYYYSQAKTYQPIYKSDASINIRLNNLPKDNSNTIPMLADLANSQILIEKTLLDSVIVQDNNDLLVNHFIQTYQAYYPEIWEDWKMPQNEILLSNDKSTFSQLESGLFYKVINEIKQQKKEFIGGYIDISSDAPAGKINFNFSSPDETFTHHFLNRYCSNYTDLFLQFVSHATQNAQNATSVEIDSIQNMIKTNFNELLYNRDAYQKRIKDSITDKKTKYLSREIQRQELTIDLLKLKLSEYYIQNSVTHKEAGLNTPAFLFTKTPHLPIEPTIVSVNKQILKGGIIGSTLAFFLLLFIKALINLYKAVKANRRLNQLQT